MDVIVADVVGSTTAALKPYLTGALLLGPLVAGLVVYAGLGGFGDDEPPEGETDPPEGDG
jgi:cytochrome b-561